MSLLLDALKKAEKAKDEAKRRALAPDSPAGDEDTVAHVRTRNELLDISSPLEVHSEDIPGGARLETADNPVPDAFSTAFASAGVGHSTPPIPAREQPADAGTAPRRRQTAPRSAATSPDPQAVQRAAARNVFEAKFREPNPKLPFYITMAVLGLFAFGTIIYFWHQLRPPPSLVNTNAKPPADERKIDTVDARPITVTQPGQQAPSQPLAIPGLPGQTQVPTPAAASSAPPTVAPVQVPAATPSAATKPGVPHEAVVQPRGRGAIPSTARQQGSSQPARPPADSSKLSVMRAGPEVNPRLEAGWNAYNQGDLQAARSNYQAMLRDEPINRDALLGMGALEVRANRPELAEIYYQRILDSNPRDPHALAGLFSLRAQMTDPVQTESRVKNLLANDPEAHVLHFTLGNQYAQQGRWPEAQQAYFKAFSADPENPDFAYNLAVSLDHVKQPKIALEYYRRAIALAQQRSSSFDQALARNRAQVLAR